MWKCLRRKTSSSQGKRVLLAEDNALNAEIASELMQDLGLSVDWAENGAAAVEKLESSEPDTYYAVFMDMQMPVMDGVAATLKIRTSRHADHGIPIIAMTANTFAEDRKRALDVGMNDHVAKPIDMNVLIPTLEKYL